MEVEQRYAVSPNVLNASTPAGSGVAPYSGFWRRAAAVVLDDLLIMMALVVVSLLASAALGRRGTSAVLLVYFPGVWLYYALMESSPLQATVGKIALGIKVTDEAGERIGFGRATGRFFAHIVSGLIMGIGYAMVVFTRHRQALHDMIAGTYVVRKQYSPSEIAAAGPAAPVAGWVSALVVIAFILFGPFGIGLLAAIAIPAYQNYTIREQITEGLMAAEPYKSAVAGAVRAGEPFQRLDTRSLNLATTGPWRYIDSIQVESGVVVIRYGGAANGLIATRRLMVIPGMDAARKLVWVCGHREPPPGVTLAVEGASRYTSIEPRFLPTACR